MQRECKEIVWRHNGLRIRPTTQLCQYLDTLSDSHGPYIEHIKVSLELLDGDELEWAGTALPAFSAWSSLRSITLTSNWERPRNIWEFQQELELRRGRTYDGRLYHDFIDDGDMQIVTGWPRFCHWYAYSSKTLPFLKIELEIQELWRDQHTGVFCGFNVLSSPVLENPTYGTNSLRRGKQNWLREMLLNVERVKAVLRAMHLKVGGEMWIDGLLCFRNKMQLVEEFHLNPRKGEIRMIFGY